MDNASAVSIGDQVQATLGPFPDVVGFVVVVRVGDAAVFEARAHVPAARFDDILRAYLDAGGGGS